MASYPTRTTASFQAIQPIPSAAPLDAEFNQYVGATGFLNGGTTGTKILLKSSDGSDPPLEIDQIGAGPLAEWKQNGSLKASIDNSGDLNASGISGSAGVYTFTEIPVGPASNPTTDNQLARKAYVDGRKTYFAISWFISDPSSHPVQSFNLAQKVRMPGSGSNFTTTAAVLTCSTGTASGSFQLQIEAHDPNDQNNPDILGTITVNPGTIGNEAAFTMSNQDIAGKYVYVILIAASSPLQRDVSITLHGEQTAH